MRTLFDTSVLAAAIVEAHPKHVVALPCLQRAKAGLDTGLVAAHSVAELYAVLTTLPVRPRISPALAGELIGHDVLDILKVIPLSAADYRAAICELAKLGITGGATYDALIVRAAVKARADQILTLNPVDFVRVAPRLTDRIVSL